MKQSADKYKYVDVARRIEGAGLRPTRQRVLLGGLLFGGGCRHLTAEDLFREAESSGIKVSLATVYNTLHQFTETGLLREIVAEGGASYFDTNTSPHHHFLCEETGVLYDIPEDSVVLGDMPAPPAGSKISGVDVIVRIRQES